MPPKASEPRTGDKERTILIQLATGTFWKAMLCAPPPSKVVRVWEQGPHGGSCLRPLRGVSAVTSEKLTLVPVSEWTGCFVSAVTEPGQTGAFLYCMDTGVCVRAHTCTRE